MKPIPFVSVCTPTFNRRPFITTMLDCFRNQTYPKDRMEWIIVDDGTDKIKDLLDNANISQIKYFALDTKMTLGAKRNFMHEQSSGSIIVYMDDDDYYPPERVQHAVDVLQANKKALCAGSSELYLYFKHIQKMYQFGPYGPNHATAGTFAFKRELLNHTKYNENACLAEEREFLKEYTIPFAQLDPLKTILVFSHIHNTFDKRKLLCNPSSTMCKVSDKTVEQFIKFRDEAHIKRFFLEDIDGMLADYAAGRPEMKPDVVQQTKEMDERRNKTITCSTEVAAIIQGLQQNAKQLTERNSELERRCEQYVKTIIELNRQLVTKKSEPCREPTVKPPSVATVGGEAPFPLRPLPSS